MFQDASCPLPGTDTRASRYQLRHMPAVSATAPAATARHLRAPAINFHRALPARLPPRVALPIEMPLHLLPSPRQNASPASCYYAGCQPAQSHRYSTIHEAYT